jgi:hypothetical protein
VLPIAENAEPDELLLLRSDELLGVGAAGLAERVDLHVPDLAPLFLLDL